MKGIIEKTLLLATLTASLCGCIFTGGIKNPQRLREQQKDSIICATYLGIPLGESLSVVKIILDSLESAGRVSSISMTDYKEEWPLDDALDIIDALSVSKVCRFSGFLSIKEGEKYTTMSVLNRFGFRNDSLYVVVITPDGYSSDLSRGRVLETYSEKYGELYDFDSTPKRIVYNRLYSDGWGLRQNHINEMNAYSANSFVWRYKDVEIYLTDKIDYYTIYTYNGDSFVREWREIDFSSYGYNEAQHCERIKDRLYGSRKNEQYEREFIAYKYLPIHKSETERIRKEIECRTKENDRKRAIEDSTKNAKRKELYRKQDI